jgi:hypothetical protein
MRCRLIRIILVAVFGGVWIFTHSTRAGETNTLDDRLEQFRPFLGKTWRGEFKDSKPGHPMVDVARWERALNGKAIRILHSVNNGEYGGESIVSWDAEQQEVRYSYFTTAGFQTTGTATFAGGKIVMVEKVRGNANGVTEVRSTCELRADGTMLSKSDYLKDGKVVGGREVLYREDPKAEVKFK